VGTVIDPHLGHNSFILTDILSFHNQRQWLEARIAQSVQGLATSWTTGIFMNNKDDAEQVILVTDFKKGRQVKLPLVDVGYMVRTLIKLHF
jgi:hypothetical protein